ncbi:MAG: hypothetical protein K0R44_3 [Thermomicrobiales bacterium]|jgi:hypothetical protein|nr:hypothetical protein [Thermomicrobiales bacterium]MDF3014778.1 hypothetical protein [Thermomicrobiales bacterium]
MRVILAVTSLVIIFVTSRDDWFWQGLAAIAAAVLAFTADSPVDAGIWGIVAGLGACDALLALEGHRLRRVRRMRHLRTGLERRGR